MAGKRHSAAATVQRVASKSGTTSATGWRRQKTRILRPRQVRDDKKSGKRGRDGFRVAGKEENRSATGGWRCILERCFPVGKERLSTRPGRGRYQAFVRPLKGGRNATAGGENPTCGLVSRRVGRCDSLEGPQGRLRRPTGTPPYASWRNAAARSSRAALISASISSSRRLIAGTPIWLSRAKSRRGPCPPGEPLALS